MGTPDFWLWCWRCPKLMKSPKSSLFDCFGACPWVQATSTTWQMVAMTHFKRFWRLIYSYWSMRIEILKSHQIYSLEFEIFYFLWYCVLELSHSLNLIHCRLRSDSENPPQIKLCDFTSHPDSLYFDKIDRFGFLDHHLESKGGCINLLYWETPLETSDSGSPTVEKNKMIGGLTEGSVPATLYNTQVQGRFHTSRSHNLPAIHPA